jgi:hypothetical protein
MQERCGIAKLVSGLIVAMSLLACGSADLEETEALAGTIHQEIFGGDLGKALGSPLVVGDTCGKSNDFIPTCDPANSAPNVVYTWTAPSTDLYTFSTAGSTLDTVLEVRTFMTSLECRDDDEVTLSQQASVRNLSLTAGQTVLVAVDGYGPNNCGSFKLSISGSCPGACNSPPAGGCYESTGTCNSGTCNYKPKAAGAACSDSNACTGGDFCNGTGSCVAGEPLVCNSPPDSCHYASGTCSATAGCRYVSRCSAGQYCYNGSCCSGSYYQVSDSKGQQGVSGNRYACPALRSR